MTSFTRINIVWNLLGPIHDMLITGDMRVSSRALLITVTHTPLPPSQSCTGEGCGKPWNVLRSDAKVVIEMFINVAQEMLCLNTEFQQLC